MKKSGSIIHYSLFAALVSGVIVPGNAAVRVNNASRSYAGAYNQVNAMRNEAQEYQNVYSDIAVTTPGAATVETGNTTVTLPVRVADSELAKKIAMADPTAPVAMDNLQSCAMIYPNGEFAWDVPNLGMKQNTNETCVAVVELRGYQMGPRGEDLVLARANLAAGDAIKCNVSEFPESSYTEDAGRVTFPADAEPTIDDVISVLNDEQKQNAGFKIAAGSIIGVIGGNMIGKSAPGSDGLFGTNKEKIQTSLIGAVTGAGIAAGGTYAGKVGGDIILSTGINAAAGSMVGNMVASAGSGSALRIENCTIDGKETSCLWGVLIESQNSNTTGKKAFYNLENSEMLLCNDVSGAYSGCSVTDAIQIKLTANNERTTDQLTPQDIANLQSDPGKHFHISENTSKGKSIEPGADSTGGGIYYEVDSYRVPTRKIPAMVAGVKDKTFGLSHSSWVKWRAENPTATVYGRNGNGTAYAIDDPGTNLQNFYPINVGADSGGIIDYSNKARMKGTLTGAGLGGAMGAFTGYQGAQKDIDDRWVAAVREYKDSLSKVYCATGTRFLSQYNDIASIPAQTEIPQ